MVKVVELKCPSCNAALTLEEGREQIFCQYCGAKVVLHNENEHIYRHIDEAGIKQAETNRIVQLKQMEMAEKQQKADEKTKKFKIIISIILGVVGTLLMTIGYLSGSDSDESIAVVGLFLFMAIAYIWLFSNNKNNDNLYDGKVRVPSAVEDFEKKNYQTIEAAFQSAGFNDIKCIPLNDLTIGLLKKPGTVESITVNGNNITSGGAKYWPDAKVVVSYHSYPEKK